MATPTEHCLVPAGYSGVSLRKRALPELSEKPQHTKLRCHFCRTQDADISYFICSNYPACKCGFCYYCLQKEFGIDIIKKKKGKWPCMVCQKLCKCPRCQLRYEKKVPTLLQEERSAQNSDTLKVIDWRKETCLSSEPIYRGPKQYQKKYLDREKMPNQKSNNGDGHFEKIEPCSPKFKATPKLPNQKNPKENNQCEIESVQSSLMQSARKSKTSHQKRMKKKQNAKNSKKPYESSKSLPHPKGRPPKQSANPEEEKKIEHDGEGACSPMEKRNMIAEERESNAIPHMSNGEFPAFGFPEYFPFCLPPSGNFMPFMGPDAYPFPPRYGMIDPSTLMFGAPFADPSIYPQYDAHPGFGWPRPNAPEEFPQAVPRNPADISNISELQE